MRHGSATRADLERLARWLTVERPDLRPVIPQALDLVTAVSTSPSWAEARAGEIGELAGERHGPSQRPEGRSTSQVARSWQPCLSCVSGRDRPKVEHWR